MKIEKLLANRIDHRCAERLIPPAIVADVLEMAMAALENMPFPDGLTVADVIAEDWQKCETCDALLREDGAHLDVEGTPFCAECWEAVKAEPENRVSEEA